MSFSKEEAIVAFEYIKGLKISAELDTRDGKTLCFVQTPERPSDFSEDICSILDICIEHHQRSVFTGEYLSNDNMPPGFRTDNALDEINFYLAHYHHFLLKEVEKGLDLISPSEDEMRPKRKSSPFVKAMLKHRVQQRQNK